MARQVKVKPTKVASRLSHQGLITLIVKESLKKKEVDWNHFLFWNEFQTNLQQDNKGKSLLQRSPLPLRAVKERGGLSHLQRSQQSHPLPNEKS
jgi:hypothetical protein